MRGALMILSRLAKETEGSCEIPIDEESFHRIISVALFHTLEILHWLSTSKQNHHINECWLPKMVVG